MRPIARVAGLLAVAAAGVAGACMNPEVEARQWDEIQALTNSLSELREYTNSLEQMIDSLSRLSLKQDTALRLIVDFTGAQVPAYRPPGSP